MAATVTVLLAIANTFLDIYSLHFKNTLSQIPDRKSGNWGLDNNARFCFCHFVSHLLFKSNFG